MIEYIKNIIPRIKQYSKELNKAENFIDKKWIFIDDNGNNHQYLFLREKRLIMTIGATTKEGSWELLPTDQLLITRGTNDLILLENMFVEEALLVLKRSVTDDTPFVLINQKLIPDLDVISYLENFEQEKERRTIPEPERKFKVLATGELSGPSVYEGKIIEIDSNIILSGTYKMMTNENSREKYVEVYKNRIIRVFFKIKYLHNNSELIIEQKELYNPTVGDKVIDGAVLNIPVNKFFKITSLTHERFSIKVNNDFKVIFSFDSQIAFIFKLVFIIFWFALLFVLFSNLLT